MLEIGSFKYGWSTKLQRRHIIISKPEIELQCRGSNDLVGLKCASMTEAGEPTNAINALMMLMMLVATDNDEMEKYSRTLRILCGFREERC